MFEGAAGESRSSSFGAEAVGRLRAALEQSGHPMLIADDERRWVTGNEAACGLLGIVRDEIPWRKMDDFTPPSERARLAEQWEAFLTGGVIDVHCQLCVPDRGAVSVEFRATANVLPARHLTVFIPSADAFTEQPGSARAPAAWSPIAAESNGRSRLTERQCEVMTLVASGLESGDIAERLVLSLETVKSHVQNAMLKLDSRTRAHAVAVALMTGQIPWDSCLWTTSNAHPPFELARPVD